MYKTAQTHKMNPAWQWLIAMLIVFAGGLINGGIFHLRYTEARKTAQAHQEGRAHAILQAVVQECELFTDVLESIRSLHNISEQVTARDFEEFLEKGMLYQRRILGGFGLAQRLNHADRMMRARADTTIPGAYLRITEFDTDFNIVDAARRQEYYPLTFQTPADALPVPSGYDFNSTTEGQRAITEMIASGKTVMAGPAYQLSQSQNDPAYYVFSPILYQSMPGVPLPFPPPGYLIGFAVSLFKPAAILEAIEPLAAESGFNTEFLPYDARPADQPYPTGIKVFEQTVMVGGKPWKLVNWSSPALTPHLPVWWRDRIFWFGIFITILVALEWMLQAGRTVRIERLVQSRTDDLRAAKELIEQEMRERARLEKEIDEVAHREKLRIGRDLHDSLGQKLTGAVLLSRVLVRKAATGTADKMDEARQLNALLKEAVTQVRRLAHGLAPVNLGNTGLSGALEHLSKEISQTCDIRCTFSQTAADWEPIEQQAEHLYHIAQEAASNAVKHSGADTISIELTLKKHSGEMKITDNGHGFAPDMDAAANGIGLRMMRHRAEIIGGKLLIEENASGGTTVICRI